MEKFGTQIINFIVILVLSRILTPEDFGTISIIASIVYILNVFMDGGFGTYIIQKDEIKDEELSTIFYTNITVAILFYILLLLFSNSIGTFYDIDNFYVFINVLASVLLINSFGIVQFSLIVRNLQYNRSFSINMISLIISAIVAIILALLNYGIWSLILFYILNSLVKLILYFYYSDWKPSFLFDLVSLKISWRFSKNILFSSLVDACYNKGINFFIGKISSTSELRFYEQASKAKDIPTNAISSSLRSVFLPMFAKLKGENKLIIKDFKKGIQVISYIVVPLSFIFYLFSDFIILILFSEKWLKSSYYLEILSFTMIPYILYYLNIDLFKSKGNSKQYMKINVYTKLIGIVLIIISSFFGLKYILYSFVFVYWMSYIYSTIMTKKNINYGALEQLRVIVPFVLKCLFIYIIFLLFEEYVDFNNFYVEEILKLFLFIIIYILLTYRVTKKLLRKILRK